jgi:hypothetical protein
VAKDDGGQVVGYRAGDPYGYVRLMAVLGAHQDAETEGGEVRGVLMSVVQ